MQRQRSEFMWRCSQWGCGGGTRVRGEPRRRPRTALRRRGPWRAHVREARHYAETRARPDLVRRPHPAGASWGGRGAERAVGERREGDAARGLPARAGRARAPPAGGRPRAARADDPALRQRRGVTGVQHRGHFRARAAGAPHPHEHFHATRPWGLSTIDVADQTRFFLHIDRRVPRRHRRYAMRLLGSIVPAQRWGIARARPRGWALYFKGGWGSGSGWADHQVALLRRGRRRLSVAILITSSPSHAYAQRDAARRGGAPAARPAPELRPR